LTGLLLRGRIEREAVVSERVPALIERLEVEMNGLNYQKWDI
jgi:hypothetical protein